MTHPQPVRLLTLPGIGDCYWVAVGLRAWLDRIGVRDVPVVSLWDFDGRRRTIEYLERLPMLTAGDYFNKPPHPGKLPEFRDTYHTGARSVVPGFLGFDYYVAVNGALVTGRTIADALDVDPAALDWYPELRRTDADRAAEARFLEKYGRYCVLHLSGFGMFSKWTAAWDIEACATFIREIKRRSGLTMLLTGGDWDRPLCAELAKRTDALDLCGETGPDAFFGMLHGATAVAGWCGGNTILATALRKPTVMLWSRAQFRDPRFFRNACPPDAWERWYRAGTVEDMTPRAAAIALDLALEDSGESC